MNLRRANVSRLLALALAVLLCSLPGAAQSAGSAAQAAPRQDEKAKKDRKKKKAEETVSASDTVFDPAVERRHLTRVLRAFSDGFEGKSPRRVTEMLDASFYDFPRFEDGVTQFLERSSEMRMFFRESTSEVKGDKATLIVDAEMTYADKANPTAQLKRRERIQFDFIRTPKGWKIYEISPRSFFTP